MHLPLRKVVQALRLAAPVAASVRPKARPNLALEALEDRCLLSLTGGPLANFGTSYGTQRESANASSANGNSVVVWNDNLQIKAQIIDPYGNYIDGTINITNSSLNESEPTVAMDRNGDFVVAWTETQPSGADTVKAEVFDPNGNPMIGEFMVAGGIGSDHGAKVAMDGQGDFVVAYTRDGVGTGSQVWASAYYSNGSLRRQMIVGSQSFTDMSHPSVTMAPSGSFLPAGSFAIGYQSGNGVGLKQYDPSGNLLHSEGVNVGWPSINPSVAMDYQGEVLVAYQTWVNTDMHANDHWEVRSRFVHSDGSIAAEQTWPSNSTALGSQLPAVAFDAQNDNYVVAYLGTNWSGDQLLNIAEVTVNGQTINSLHGTYVSTLDAPSVSVNGYHRYLVTFTSLDSGSAEWGDIARQFGQLGGLPGPTQPILHLYLPWYNAPWYANYLTMQNGRRLY
jgi:hypothetical protein